MPFPFAFVCDLLDKVEGQIHARNNSSKTHGDIIARWFQRYRHQIDHPDTQIPALFSTLLPTKRADRVYGIQATSLQRIIGRALCLGQSRIQQLRKYEEPGRGEDLADCVANILTETPSPMYSQSNLVTVEEIDSLLHDIAANCRYSARAVRLSKSTLTVASRDRLGHIYMRFDPREAKWFTRLVLKTYEPVVLDPIVVYRCFDRRMGAILKVQEDFDVALDSLQKLRTSDADTQSRPDWSSRIKPILGTKVSRPFWRKGRSIKHCINICHGLVSCENKVDGEYCQIHVDLSKGHRSIQIFSKSGKDSTEDRAGVHQAIRNSLGLRGPNPAIIKGCILEGELVVYNDRLGEILPFHKIRKYVTRSGRFLGIENDSPPDPDDHLMMVYYDVLMIDDDSLLGVSHSCRFKRLEELICCRKGHAELVQRQIINLAGPTGASDLRRVFATSITSRSEGLVLKPDHPYFDLTGSQRSFCGSPVKLKKEYIGEFGDIGDFAVVGARYDPVKAKSYRIPGLKYTHFYTACLTNKDSVRQHGSLPCFTTIDCLELNEVLLKTVVNYANPRMIPIEENEEMHLLIPPRLGASKGPTMVFPEPLVFDVRCFSFEKQGNTGFWSPRFPNVSKVHFDRDYLDALTFTELQTIAENATALPKTDESQELLEWIAKLERADPKGVPVDARTQSTVSSMPTPSPQRASMRSTRSVSTVMAGSPTSNRSLPPILEDQPTALVTPPTSSIPVAAAQPPTTTSPSGSSINAGCEGVRRGSTTRRKRERQDDLTANCEKRLKHISHSPSSTSSQRHSSPYRATPPTQRPLAETSVNISPSPTKPSPNTRMSQQEMGKLAMAGPLTQVVRGCQLKGQPCMLSSRDYIVAPYIAKQHRAVDKLLPLHGITKWVTDPQQWERKNACYAGDTSAVGRDDPAPEPVESAPSKRRRKVCFVERVQRKEESVAFLRQIEGANLRLPDGGREWVEVYDWRVLEDIRRSEKAGEVSDPARRAQIWGKWRVGLA